MAKTLMPLASTKVLVGACDNWANYTCGWGDPLGTASIDFAVQQSSMVINLSPDTSKHPAQAAMFAVFAAHMGPLGAFSGWAEPESDMVALLSKKDGVVVCGVRGALTAWRTASPSSCSCSRLFAAGLPAITITTTCFLHAQKNGRHGTNKHTASLLIDD